MFADSITLNDLQFYGTVANCGQFTEAKLMKLAELMGVMRDADRA